VTKTDWAAKRRNKRAKRREIWGYLKLALGWPSSKYSELFTYLTAITCAILFFSHPDFRQFISDTQDAFVEKGNGIYFLAVGLFALAGFFYSIFHAFSLRPKTSIEKYCMGAFAIGANALAGIIAGAEEFNTTHSIFVLFPIWNIIVGIVMLFQIRESKFEITDENVSSLEVWIASTTLIIVFAIAYLAFDISWAMTFSICMFYSSWLVFFITRLLIHFNIRSNASESSVVRHPTHHPH
jgi:hypothetical protein